MDWWLTLTEPQATVLAGLLTLVSAIIVSVIVPFLVGSKFTDVKEAAEKASGLTNKLKSDLDNFGNSLNTVKDVLKGFQTSFDQTRTQITVVKDLIDSFQTSLNQVRNQVADISSVTEAEAAPQADPQEAERQNELKSLWSEIRDRVEEIAADPNIDGRTRARYSRIDRRTFQRLIQALDADKRLGVNGPPLMEAVNLWHKYRTGRLSVAPEALARMKELRDLFLRNGA